MQIVKVLDLIHIGRKRYLAKKWVYQIEYFDWIFNFTSFIRYFVLHRSSGWNQVSGRSESLFLVIVRCGVRMGGWPCMMCHTFFELNWWTFLFEFGSNQIRYVNICLGHWFYLQTCTFANFGPRRTSFFDGIESKFSPLWSHFLGFFLMKSIKFTQKHLNLQFFIILYTFWYKIAKF